MIDLHTHTTASDGSLSPRDLITESARFGLSAVAVTDHDTTDGLDEALAAGGEVGIRVIPGVELSVDHQSGSIHLLAYGIDHHDPEFNRKLNSLRSSRDERNCRIVARLCELGYPITIEAVQSWSNEGTTGRGHIGQALVAAGYTSSVEEAFDKLLSKGGPAYIDRYRMKMGEAIRLVHEIGGIAVWAHPGLHEHRLDSLLKLLPSWVAWGLDGLESDYSQHTIELSGNLRRIAKEQGLIITGGSDFHGLLKPNIKLGSGPEGRPIGDELLDALDKQLASIRTQATR